MERLSEDQLLFIWLPVLGFKEGWSEYCNYCFECDIDNIVNDEEDQPCVTSTLRIFCWVI